jgi:NADPH-dependent curcumin reductase CurA
MINRRYVLASRPTGLPTPDNFRIDEVQLPELKPGQVLVQNKFISVDPGMRGRMSQTASYVASLAIGDPLGLAAAGKVLESRDPSIKTGDWVATYLGWQTHGVVDAAAARRITDLRLSPSTSIGVLGIPGLTAYFGMLDIAQPKTGETAVITSAAGGVGSIAAQVAKIRGCRVVGIAGGPDKCRWLTEELGLDAAIDYRAEPDLSAAIAARCPNGVDIHFENVGNAFVEAVLGNMNRAGRLIISGNTADYNVPAAQRAAIRNTSRIITHRLTIRGLVAFDYADRFPAALAELTEWIIAGRLKYREDIARGFERLPQTFIGLFKGENFGRQIVEIEQ